ncbi:MAG: PSD1 and planctomycete cytochrome C domain-containing protein [Fuerstiella sp.]
MSLATINDSRANDYVVPGDPESSYLLEVVTSVDGEEAQMPKDGRPLSDEEVAKLRRWIAAGADWPQDVVIEETSKADATWWSLQPLGVVPDSLNDLSIPQQAQAIDEFINDQLQQQGLKRNSRADAATLIRRVTYDLTGLPPTPEEVDAFVRDQRPDAWERLVDRLLASPHYGERWGRHWLDVVRFGESNGFERNVIINSLWPFRDYVIRSLNEDKPFDDFIREHLAGDVGESFDPDRAVGSAFLVAGPYDDVGNQDPVQAAQIRANTIDEMIRATGEAFLGLTIGCARCHNHKFDPITQRDYYSLYATFAGVRHGQVPLGSPQQQAERQQKLQPLNQRKAELEAELNSLEDQIVQRGRRQLAEYTKRWHRPAVDRAGTEDRFEPVTAKFVRLICESSDINPNGRNFRIDEFEVWSAPPETAGDSFQPANVALAANGGKATGAARRIEDFPDAYGAHHAIDGKTGARFIAAGNHLTIELARPTRIDRVVFSSAKNESSPEHSKFQFVAEYRIEVSSDGKHWQQVSGSSDRLPVGGLPEDLQQGELSGHLRRRLVQLETTEEDETRQAELRHELAQVREQLAKIPDFPVVWIGLRDAGGANGPFNIFLGGSPQKKGPEVVPGSLEVLQQVAAVSSASTDVQPATYELAEAGSEDVRREALADWIVNPANPITPRVLANRIWHYHFGTGIVNTPSDFGYMGGRPSHPQLLDWLAANLIQQDWQIKPLHKAILMTETYRQSSDFQPDAAAVDADARLLWRFPPRRLSAEEVRDTMLAVAGKLQIDHSGKQSVPDGGPGFRLYHFMQDNVCTYVPLDEHGPETYRRAVYHQNARASVVDLMTEFDQPDCAFSTPRRAETTTPLQALTMLNHDFTLDMAESLAERVQKAAGDHVTQQIHTIYRLCYGRTPTPQEETDCQTFLQDQDLPALCRVILNTSELLFVR